MIVHRVRVLIGVLGVVIAAAAGGWIAGTNIRSPAEVAARTAPPAPSKILVPAEQRVLTSRIIARGSGRFGSPLRIELAASDIKASPGRISSLPKAGAVISGGETLLVLSGRPVFVLAGNVPMYRDMGYGVSGNDVLQFEKALDRMGFPPGAVDGFYDEETGAAVRLWYGSKGWEPFATTSQQLAAIRALEQEFSVANAAIMKAQAAILSAQVEVDASATAYDLALQSLQIAENSVLAVKADAEASNLASASESKALEIDGAVSQKIVAMQKSEFIRLSGELKVQTALLGIDRAKADVAAADARRSASVRSLTALEVELTMATEQSHRTEKDLQSARLHAGVQVPADELVFVPSFPIRVQQIYMKAGDFAAGLLMVVTDSNLVVDSAIPLDEAKLIRGGMKVAIDEADLGIKTSGVVTLVDSTPGTHGVDGYHVYFEVSVDDRNAQIDGISVRLTIPIESSGGAVLSVPVSAVSISADGASRIEVKRANSFEYLTVVTGLVADGYAAVTPVSGKLTPGDLVVIGYGPTSGGGA